VRRRGISLEESSEEEGNVNRHIVMMSAVEKKLERKVDGAKN